MPVLFGLLSETVGILALPQLAKCWDTCGFTRLEEQLDEQQCIGGVCSPGFWASGSRVMRTLISGGPGLNQTTTWAGHCGERMPDEATFSFWVAGRVQKVGADEAAWPHG